MLDETLITYLANLSKLEVDEEEKQKFVSEMSSIVNLMDTIGEIEIEEGIELNGPGVGIELLREDAVVPSYENECVLKNAAHKKDGFFVVPKIME